MINIIAAENVYGNVAKELGGPFVNVVNILNNPAQDPHLFSINPSTAKAVRYANIIIMNGANYDPWMNSLLSTTNDTKFDKKFYVIIISKLVPSTDKKNPHLWYLPETMPIFSQQLVEQFILQDPSHRQYYEERLSQFNHDYQVITHLIKQMKDQYRGTPVIATEPLFNYMAQSIGLKVYGEAFQLSVMNDLPPSISATREFEDYLRQHHVFLMFYNNQVVNQSTRHMISIAKEEKIPVIGMSEMMPNHITYVQWMKDQLLAVDHALAALAGSRYERK
jgi:zinc/manganese transport system substrate-binding protein